MRSVDTKIAIDELIGADDVQTDQDYDAWFRAKVQATLDAKARGEMTYRSLDEVAAELGFNAR